MEAYLTPPKLAARWGVKPEKIISFIRAGKLRAFDVSSCPGEGRPRYRISPDAVIEFENRWAEKPPTKKLRRRKSPSNVIEFF